MQSLNSFIQTDKAPSIYTKQLESYQAFNLSDINEAIQLLKTGKACGADDVSVELIKHMGPVAILWVLGIFNTCPTTYKIPKLWRRVKVVALLEPGKSPDDPKSYRPISLFCHTYKLFESLLLNRLMAVVDAQLTPE